MEITLTQIGKRFRFEWIFKDIDYQFSKNQRYAILGSNGSGKSTLMKIISGQLTPTKGEISFFSNGTNKAIDIDSVYRFVSFAAPYIELIEEFTLTEILDFHQKFKQFNADLNTEKIIQLLGFEKSRHKEVRFFSSGMKQRLKLALAICTETPLLLLDEPTTNLDSQGAAWYRELLLKYGINRTVIIATNVEVDYIFFYDKQLNIINYK
jgi:ABC-type multidrug transport system ATPase subunit